MHPTKNTIHLSIEICIHCSKLSHKVSFLSYLKKHAVRKIKIISSVEDWTNKRWKRNLPLKKCLEKHKSAIVSSKLDFREINEGEIGVNLIFFSCLLNFSQKIWNPTPYWEKNNQRFEIRLLFVRKTAADLIFNTFPTNLRSKIQVSTVDNEIFRWRNV